MSARLIIRILHLSAGLVCLTGLAEAQADGLKHDPFVRPVLAPRPASAAPAPANTVKAPLPEPVWKPELRAIMMAGPKSIVNVEGALVRIGEQIDGYRLVEVHEETAVFVNNNKRVTLSLRGIEPLRNPPPRQDDRELKERRNPQDRRNPPPRQDDRGTNERRDAPPGQADRGVAQRRDDSSKPEDK
ncbi:MAG: hypothetical protein Q7R45_07650 [Sulfuricaulis sp.]|nr:hypothetical protein [Sulfuricaulis sp.]